MDNFLAIVASVFGRIGIEGLTAAIAGLFFITTTREILPKLLRAIVDSIVEGPVPISHKIAVIGLPGAGKTTLITALFDLIQRGIHIKNARLHGMNTIKRVNKNVALLNSGQPIGPTKERDTFVFRFSFRKPTAFKARSYDVEIADFPGEYSDRISLPEEEIASDDLDLDYTLFNKEFFSWIASSREYVFLVDLSSIYSSENIRFAIADLTARIRTSWQVIEDAVSERAIGSPRNRSVYIVFAKMDSLLPLYLADMSLFDLIDTEQREHSDAFQQDVSPARKSSGYEALKQSIRGTGQTPYLAGSEHLSNTITDLITRENDSNFRDLIAFFQSRTKNMKVIYTSMTVRDELGERLGTSALLEAILP
jgi:hypothetical protein